MKNNLENYLKSEKLKEKRFTEPIIIFLILVFGGFILYQNSNLGYDIDIGKTSYKDLFRVMIMCWFSGLAYLIQLIINNFIKNKNN